MDNMDRCPLYILPTRKPFQICPFQESYIKAYPEDLYYFDGIYYRIHDRILIEGEGLRDAGRLAPFEFSGLSYNEPENGNNGFRLTPG